MTKLSNYLYKDIIESIICTILYYKSLLKYNNNNEIIQLSIVCKSWFIMVEQLLPIYIKENNLEFVNGLMESLQSAYQLQYQYKTQHQFKLVKLRNSSISIPVSEDSSIIPIILEYSKIYKNIYLEVRQDGTANIIQVLNQLPDNVYLSLFYNPSSSPSIKNHHSNSKICLLNPTLKDLYQTLQVPPRELHYPAQSLMDPVFGLIFESTSTQKINIFDLILPSRQFNINNIINKHGLQVFSTITTPVNMMKAIDSVPQGQIKNIDKLKWQYVVNKLSNDPTLIEFDYFEDSIDDELLTSQLTLDEYYDGIKSILVNQKSLAKVILSGFRPMNIKIIEGLALNKSIKYFEFGYGTDVLAVTQRFLLVNKNRQIKDIMFIINDRSLTSIFESLKIFQSSQFDLFSLTLKNERKHLHIQFLNKIINYISVNQFPIKQINITNTGFNSSIKLLNSNSIHKSTILNIS